MNDKQAGIFRWILLGLTLVVILFAALQTVTVSTFNNTPRFSEGLAETEPVYADLHPRGLETSSWIKQETNLEGNIYDISLFNHSDMMLNSWTLQLNILDDCFLNQFWNGEVEIHQHAASETERIQRLNLARYEKDQLTLEYTMDGSDLLIPLSAGDYLIYYPSASIGETPVEAGDETVVGTIFYQPRGTAVDLSDYSVSFFYKQSLTQGPLFIIFCVMAVALVLLASYYYSSQMAYRRAQKEMDNRVSGISCMTELYNLIYIIDTVNDVIIPVGIDEKDDEKRPKNMTAKEQVDNFFRTDAKPEFIDMMLVFSNLETLPKRLMDRGHIVQEYESRYYGFCRIYFIAMENRPGREPRRILFTVQQINDEKKEMQSIMLQVEKARSEKGESRKFMESISAGIQTPLRSILARSGIILEKSDEQEIRNCATDIMQTGEMVLSMVDSTLDLVRLSAGTMKTARVPYSFRHLMERVEDSFRISTMEKELDFRMNISPDIPDMLIGDGPKLRQILLNLLGRSMSSLDSGTIVLRVFSKRTAKDRIHLLFSVLETGNMTGLEDAGQSMELLDGLLGLMDSTLNSVRVGESRDCYFEIDQGIPEPEVRPQTESAAKK